MSTRPDTRSSITLFLTRSVRLCAETRACAQQPASPHRSHCLPRCTRENLTRDLEKYTFAGSALGHRHNREPKGAPFNSHTW